MELLRVKHNWTDLARTAHALETWLEHCAFERRSCRGRSFHWAFATPYNSPGLLSVLSPPAEPLSDQQQQQHPICFVLISHGGTLGGSHSTLHTLCPLQASSCTGSSSLWEQSLYWVTLGHAMTTWSLIPKQDHLWCCSHSDTVVQPHQPADHSLRWDERARQPCSKDS